MIPDVPTLRYDKMGDSDIVYLETLWTKKDYNGLSTFLDKFETDVSLCKGRITMMSNTKLPNKKFSWTRFRKNLHIVRSKLNTPIEIVRGEFSPPVRNPEKFMTFLRLPPLNQSQISCSLNTWVALYYLSKRRWRK